MEVPVSGDCRVDNVAKWRPWDVNSASNAAPEPCSQE